MDYPLIGEIMAALLPLALSVGTSIASSYMNNKGTANPETKMQGTKRKLVDQLLGSLQGQGPYKDLFSFDEGSFQKSFVEPAQAMFRNQIAPQIQQQYIASGQQRGTGLDDTLTRAGVDMNSLLNQQMMQYQEAAKNRSMQGINNIFGMNDGAPNQQTGSQSAMQGLGGLLSSSGFSDMITGALSPYLKGKSATPSVGQSGQIGQRKGYEYNPNINYGTST